MKTFYPIFCLMVYLLLAWQCTQAPQQSGTASPSDSIYTSQYITKIYIDDPQRALGLVDTAESRGNIPDLQANYFRYSIYNGKGMYHIAEDYLKKAMKSDSMKTIAPQQEFKLKSAFVDLNIRLSNYAEAMRVATELCEKARKDNNRRMESEMLYSIGMIYRAQFMHDEAEAYSAEAIRLLEDSHDVRELAYLSYIYGMQMAGDMSRKEFGKAIETGEKRELLIGRISGMAGPPKGYVDEQYGFLYSKLASAYEQDGQPGKAAGAYGKFNATRFSKTLIGRRDAVPYLLESGQYKKAAAIIPGEEIFGNDTVNLDFIIHLGNLAKIAAGSGDYRSQASYLGRITAIQDSLTARDKQNAAIELATIYQTNEKNRQIEEQNKHISRQRATLYGSVALLLLAGLAIFFICQHLRAIKRKNRFLAKQIDSQLAYREELKKANAEIELLKQQLQAGTEEEMPEAAAEENARRTSELNKKLFAELDRLIDEEKLYLDPDISRDQLLKQIHISKNVFAGLIQTYNGTNFNTYMNNKRLDHSLSLLKDFQGYTIEAVAVDSGFNSVRSFYRIFRDKYGMTPSEYRNTLEQG